MIYGIFVNVLAKRNMIQKKLLLKIHPSHFNNNSNKFLFPFLFKNKSLKIIINFTQQTILSYSFNINIICCVYGLCMYLKQFTQKGVRNGNQSNVQKKKGFPAQICFQRFVFDMQILPSSKFPRPSNKHNKHKKALPINMVFSSWHMVSCKHDW